MPPYCKLRECVKNVRMLVSPLWHGPSNIYGFVLGGRSYRKGWVLLVPGVRVKTAVLGTCNFITVACGRYSLVTDN